jgi:hypothetical protein
MEEFEDLIAKGGFVEHAKFGSNRYGTSRRMIEEKMEAGKVVILDIEMEVSFGSAFLNKIAQGLTGYRASSRSRTPPSTRGTCSLRRRHSTPSRRG